ncbi:methyltransferase domain-containing protein [Tannockella kyphosi]|uniref:methyltransferase domain-containing protein n=1 Tax=Tannockella kyphosi TaxID=2899121 RepID=UPI002012BADC|nr:methyltransferase domain-containing protein [Tannockella kyphosi]
MHKLACPKCFEPLHIQNNSYICSNNHCFDIAKSKYINLLLNPVKATNNPGDSKESLLARKAYLDNHYYDCILHTVEDTIKKYQKESMHLLDLGCGQGYYTKSFQEDLGKEHTYYGLDISKVAINMATKYTKDIYWIVGNSKALPFSNQSLDIITAMFTVVNNEELERTLKDDGYIIHVTANPNHLIEIKELIYDEIKIKSDQYIRLPFQTIESYDLTQKVSIPCRGDALNLLMMTPHYYHIKKERRHVLDTLSSLDVTVDIKVTVYKKEEK